MNKCNGCDLCCRKYRIYLFPSEAKKIARELKINYKEFVSKHLDYYFEFFEIPSELNAKSDFIQIDKNLFSDNVVLLPTLSIRKNESCYFLKNSECIIYKSRPTICKLFPKLKLFDVKYDFCKIDSEEMSEEERKKYYPILSKYLRELKQKGFLKVWKYLPRFEDENIFVYKNAKQIKLDKNLKQILEKIIS